MPLNPKSQGKRTVSITDELQSHLSPLTDILWLARPGINIFYGGLIRDTDILVEAPSEMQKDFLAPDFYLNCCFLCFFLLLDKRILLLLLLTQKRQFRVLCLLWKNCTCRRPYI